VTVTVFELVGTDPDRRNGIVPTGSGDAETGADGLGDSLDARAALLDCVGARAHDALDESADARERRVRDPTLVTMLAVTATRGAEPFADRGTDRR
jgi:hypothetical protein